MDPPVCTWDVHTSLTPACQGVTRDPAGPLPRHDNMTHAPQRLRGVACERGEDRERRLHEARLRGLDAPKQEGHELGPPGLLKDLDGDLRDGVADLKGVEGGWVT